MSRRSGRSTQRHSVPLAIGNAAHNGILLNALLLIRNLMQQWIGAALLVAGVQDKALDHHKKIFAAVLAGDAGAAQAAMQMHLEEMSRYLTQGGVPQVPG